MIKQVEERFAERERVVTGSQMYMNSHLPESSHDQNMRSSYMSPKRVNMNEYDMVKQSIQQKQNELINSQYSLNPSAGYRKNYDRNADAKQSREEITPRELNPSF